MATKMSQRQQMKQNALDAAMHWHAIQRARALTKDEVVQQALIRWGPVPATCQKCHTNPPTTILIHGSGVWLCRPCAGLGEQ